MRKLSAFDRGLVVGLLMREGSFGGDGKQPQLTLRMHVRHEPLMRRLVEWFPRTRLYGPYHHADRHYFQWMARGRALVEDVMPLLDAELTAELDPHAYERYLRMCERYADAIRRARSSP